MMRPLDFLMHDAALSRNTEETRRVLRASRWSCGICRQREAGWFILLMQKILRLEGSDLAS